MPIIDSDRPTVEVRDLVKTYRGGVPAVAGISFSTGRGEIFGLLGPNGSGKTTTVRILVTLLEEFGLAGAARQRASRLSGGLRRRLDLARGLIHRPSVLFLDEPTTGLDPQSRGALWDRLRSLAGDGASVLLTTQYLEEADRACDRVAIIDAGRIVVSGTPRDLKDTVGVGHLLLTTPDQQRAASLLAGFPGVTRVETGQRLAVSCREPAASLVPVIQLLRSEGIQITAAEQAQPTLDDVFLRYTGSRPRPEALVTGAVSGTFAAGHGKRRAS